MTDTITWWDKVYDPTSADTHSADTAPEATSEADPKDEPEEAESRDATPEPQGHWWHKAPTGEPSVAPPPGTTPEAAPLRPAGERLRQWYQGVDPKLASRRRWALYNGSAAGLGWGLDLVHYAGQWMLAGAQSPVGTTAVLLAAGAGTAGWWLSGHLRFLPQPFLVRPLIAVGAASYASQQASSAVAAVAHWIPVAALMPLVAGLGTAGLLAYIDRRWLHAWWPPLAWVLRAPLASAVLALAIYPTTW